MAEETVSSSMELIQDLRHSENSANKSMQKIKIKISTRLET